jgi:hypothetical protein
VIDLYEDALSRLNLTQHPSLISLTPVGVVVDPRDAHKQQWRCQTCGLEGGYEPLRAQNCVPMAGLRALGGRAV